jgi:hypothetical protein
MNDKPSTPIIVLGMHRSGTSMLAGMLDILGVYLGNEDNLMPADQDVNAKGFWEREDVVAIHEEVLATLGTNWQSVASLPSDWPNDPRLSTCKQRLLELVRSDFLSKPLWGMKDPRMCRLLPLWLDLFNALDVTPRFIHIVRHPTEVASSLAKRNGFSTDYALILWLRHVTDAISHSAGFRQCHVSYADLNKDWYAAAQKIAQELDVQWPASIDSDSVHQQMDAFISRDLWHHRDDKQPHIEVPCLHNITDAYQQLSESNPESCTTTRESTLDAVNTDCASLLRLLDQSSGVLSRQASDWYDYMRKFQIENEKLTERVHSDATKLTELHDIRHKQEKEIQRLTAANAELQDTIRTWGFNRLQERLSRWLGRS